MGSVCTDHHIHHHLRRDHHSKKVLHDVNVPPRKLLSRRSELDLPDSPSQLDAATAALMHKFLEPGSGSGSGSGGGAYDPDSDPYSSDHFRMFEFKVRRCTRSRSHDWTDCPFAHPGEKARRRDPRKYHYSGAVCPEYRRSGSCSRGDECEFAHGVFECWLHPARYRTEACKDGKNCKRKVCFFAHSPRELRVLPLQDENDGNSQVIDANLGVNLKGNHCCKYCCSLSSPNSTLLGMTHLSPPMSPSLSPPVSPMKAVGRAGLSGFSPISRYANRVGLSYEDTVIEELMGNLEGLNLNFDVSKMNNGDGKSPNGLWVDVCGYGDDGSDHHRHHHHHNHHQMQFVTSPSTPDYTKNYGIDGGGLPSLSSSSSSYFSRDLVMNGTANTHNGMSNCSTDVGFIDDGSTDGKANNNTENGAAGPDLGWVNDLLM